MDLIKRSEWGARHGVGPTNITPTGGIAIHWNGPKMRPAEHDWCAAAVRGIERFHVRDRGWQGIAYSLLVCVHGYVFEGRGVGHRTAANGTSDGNQRFYAVMALVGEGDKVTGDLKQGLVDAVGFLRKRGAGSGVVGHRELFTGTDCPGDELLAWVRAGMPLVEHPKPGATKAPAFPGRLLRYPPGVRGSDAHTWQARMRDRGWDLIPDGVYGPRSAEVCRLFQLDSTEHGWPLEADGIVGRSTWRAAFERPTS